MNSETNLSSNRALICTKAPTTLRAVARRWALLVSAVGFAVGCAAASAGEPLATTANSNGQRVEERWPEPDASVESIERLRQGAQVGDAHMALALVTRLLDLYEHGGASDELLEATIWIDRYQGNEIFASSGLITRVQQRDCKHLVMRQHWLCNVPE